MSIWRKALLAGAAVALPAGLVTVVSATSASASAFTGPASGTVTCSAINVKVKLSPPLTNSAGGTTVSFKGKISGCTVSGSTDTITSGKITGSLSNPSSSGCSGLATGVQVPINVTIKWKGKHNGGAAHFDNSTVTIGGADAAVESGTNDVGFSLPAAGNSGVQVTGSFAGSNSTPDASTDYSETTVAQAGSECGAKGIKTLKLDHGSGITLP